MVRDAGRVVVAGQYTDNGPVEVDPHAQINRKHVELRGSWGSDFSHFLRVDRLMSRTPRAVSLARVMITRTYCLDDAEKALDAVRAREVVKAAIAPNDATTTDGRPERARAEEDHRAPPEIPCEQEERRALDRGAGIARGLRRRELSRRAMLEGALSASGALVGASVLGCGGGRLTADRRRR